MQLSGYTIVFDLDGTLVETAPDLHRALNEIMRSEELSEVELNDVRAFVGQGARSLIKRGAELSGKEFTENRLNELTDQFVQIYQSDIAAKSYLYGNVISAMDTLERFGAQFCVCTNKKTHLAQQLLDTLGLSSRFKCIIGADIVDNKKPHKDHLITAIKHADGDLERSVLIGDSASDSGAAKHAGIPVILVSFGYTDIAPRELYPDAIIDNYSELPRSVFTVFNLKHPD